MAEVVYIRRSEAFGYIMGRQVGQLAQSVMEAREYAGHMLAGFARLEQLRQRLDACGSCADKAALTQEADRLESALNGEAGPLCKTFDDMSWSNPGTISGVRALSGFGDVCEAHERAWAGKARAAQEAHDLDVFRKSVAAGDNAAYGVLARSISGYRHLSDEERLNRACPYFLQGVKLSDVRAVLGFAHLCLLRAGVSKDDQQMGVARLQQCGASGVPGCVSTLARFHETTRRAGPTWPVPADDKEALRLYRQALVLRESESSKSPKDGFVQHALEEDRYNVSRVEARLAGMPAPLSPTQIREAERKREQDQFLQRKRAEIDASAAERRLQWQQEQQSRQAAREDAAAARQQEVLTRRCSALRQSMERAQAAAADRPNRNGRADNLAERYAKDCSGF